MGLKFAVLLIGAANLAQVSSFAQPSQSDRYKYAPLVTSAKLWNMIRFLHPRVTGDSTVWDSALIAAIPKIEAAHSDEDLAIALDAMLATLHDPCTRIASGLPGKGVSVQSFDQTMVIHAGNGDFSNSLGAGLMLKMGIPQTSNIVWDIRGSRLPYSLMSRPDIHQLSLNGIGYAYREHSGYAPQEGSGLRHYSSSLKIVDPPPAARRTASKYRQVYLIDKDSAVPFQAIIDQVQGRTTILSEDPPSGSQAGFTEMFHVLGKVAAEVRVAEVRYADGTTEFAPSRVMLNRGEEAVKAAVNVVDAGGPESIPGMPGERPRFQAGPAGVRDVPYADNPYPAREMRILSAIRVWGILRYFDPYVSMLGDKWDDVLVELLPKFAEAKDAREYSLAVAEMAARSTDGGCVVRGRALPTGRAIAPLEIRIVDNRPVVTRVLHAGPAQPGDVLLKIDGTPVETRMTELSRYISASGPLARQSALGRLILNGTASLLTPKPATTMNLTLQGKDGSSRDVAITLTDGDPVPLASREGDAIRLINDRIGYADLERVDSTELEGMFEKFHQTMAIVFDLRGRPKDTALGLTAYLTNHNQPVVAELFRNVVGVGSDNHVSFLETELHGPNAMKQRYPGKVVALIDGQSAGLTAENAMCLKAVGAILIGTPSFPLFSAYLTQFDVPGGIKVGFSGQIPRWPGGKLLYAEGVPPDVEAKPTLGGIREGRDEVLDAAVAYLQHEL